MSDETSGKSIVPQGNTGLVQHGRQGNKLIRRASSDALLLIENLMNVPKPLLHQDGENEFYEEDFRQLQIWASELGMDGQVTEFVEAFDEVFKNFVDAHDDTYSLEVIEDLKKWSCDGRIKFFTEFGEGKLSSPQLPKLTHLCWEPTVGPGGYSSQIRKLDLTSVPSLTRLSCGNSDLAELDLSSVPNLTWLNCRYNDLQELGLASVPALMELNCSFNKLTKLDLLSVPALMTLNCETNVLTGLDLSSVTSLTRLDCGYNDLTELKLSSMPALMTLVCVSNNLTELDLSSVPAMTELYCAGNQLKELDLSFVPSLTRLDCGHNDLTELDIRGCPRLQSVGVDLGVEVHKRPDQTIDRRKKFGNEKH